MKFAYLISAILISACIACPYVENLPDGERENAKAPEDEVHRKLALQMISTPYCLKTSGAAVTPSASNTCSAYFTVLGKWNTYMASCTSVKCKADIFGALVRLAFHDAAEVDITDDDILGPDGCLSSDSGHAGLVEGTSLVYTFTELTVYQSVCHLISRADLWVMLAKMALETAEPTGSLTIDFQYGRKDATTAAGCSVTGRLPSAEGTVDEMYRVFVTQMGMDLNDGATLLGAHSVGHMHPSVSSYGQSGDASGGYLNGFDDTPHQFDNNYYYNLLTSTWVSSASPALSSLTQFQCNDWPNTCMLPLDISIGFIRTTYSSSITQTCGQYAVTYGTTISLNPTSGISKSADGTTTTTTSTTYGYGCTPSSTVMPLTCWQTCNHGNSNSYFLSSFRTSFNKMTCAGYGVPSCSNGATGSGKLGTLTYLDLDTCMA